MTVLLEEMTREEIEQIAPNAIAVLPTASIEQHGPHLPVVTDTLLCGTVAQRAAEAATDNRHKCCHRARCQLRQFTPPPPLCWRPFPEQPPLHADRHRSAGRAWCLSGFRKLIVLNGHGGNTDSNNVVGLDFVNRLGHPVTIGTGAYWDIARSALTAQGLMDSWLIPGHAGQFETSLVMALRPDLVNEAGLARTRNVAKESGGIFGDLAGATVQTHGAWAESTGYTDNPAAATADEGHALLKVITERVGAFFTAFDQQ